MVISAILMMLLALPAFGWVVGVASRGVRRTRWAPVAGFYGVALLWITLTVLVGGTASVFGTFLLAFLVGPIVTVVTAFRGLPGERREQGFEVLPVREQPTEVQE